MKGGGPETQNKFAVILQNAYDMLANILNMRLTITVAEYYLSRLESNLIYLKKLTPLADRFELLKNILTTIHNNRSKSREEFIEFLKIKDPVIESTEISKIDILSDIVFKNPKLKQYLDMLNIIIHMFNNFKNKPIYEQYRIKIQEIESILDRRSDLRNSLANTRAYFENRINLDINKIVTQRGGKKKRSKRKRSKKKILMKKRSKKKRH